MFNNYKYIPDSYIPNNQTEFLNDNRIAKKPLEEYDAKGNIIGYSWNYGDGVILEFNTEGTATDDATLMYQTAEEYMEGKKLKLQIYNFRYEVIYEKTIPASTKAKFVIDSGESTQLPRNVYTCSLVLVDSEAGIETELFGPDNGYLYVK